MGAPPLFDESGHWHVEFVKRDVFCVTGPESACENGPASCKARVPRLSILCLLQPQVGIDMYKGSFVAMVTPMHEDGAVDDDALGKLVEFHIEQGTDGIVAVGTTGESATLDHTEHGRLIARVVELVNGRIPVIGGTGANSTAEAISLTRAAKEAGAESCLLVTPYYNKPTQEGLYRHYMAVADAVDIPQILYNVPGRTACDMLAETVARLAPHERIVGIKEATGDMQRIHDLRALCGDEFAILSGEDWMACDTIIEGRGDGVISVTANVAPAGMHQMCALALAGDAAGARAVDAKLRGLHEALFLESNPIPAKWAVAEMGLMGHGLRLPLTPLSDALHAAVRAAMEQASVTRVAA
ncbi:MAG: 4-hydroxy-tetrahydrodipicolinate synthase [Gammaproteobacteria bacterium]|jgi:4-hydroxy-tetrahydrodipicolinate synthase